MNEIYVSTDIETDGPIPGEYSMLSFGSAAYIETLVNPISTFTKNLKVLPGASQHPDTMKWWGENQKAWNAHRIDIQDPSIAMADYVAWLAKLPGKPIFVGYPAGFDFTFIYWYLVKFTGSSPFGFSAIDIKSYAMAKLKCPFKKATKQNMPREWFGPTRHTHVALDDAIGQGELFMNMLLS